MCLGAVVSAGVPLAYLQEHIAQLQLSETVDLQAKIVHKNGIAATQVSVGLPHTDDETLVQPPVRHLATIEQIVMAAQLPARSRDRSLAIFRRLAIAEGAIHGIAPESVHFHEVGATDAIVDIVGTCLGLDWLGIDAMYCAPLPTGRGTVRAAHGRLPVPAPAVLKLMEMAQVPIYNSGLRGELVTPTGAAIATELARQFGEPPAMTMHKVGLGAGTKDLAMPNILRLWIGQASDDLSPKLRSTSTAHAVSKNANHEHRHDQEPAETRHSHGHSHSHGQEHLHEYESSQPTPVIEQRQGFESVTVLATQVDDLSPQAIGYLYDCLLAANALDVFTQSVTMKKSRPGHLITVITYPEQAKVCEQILLRETTTLGVRQTQQTRLRLRREIVPLDLPLGTVRMKIAFEPHSLRPLKAHPEYEDCASLARQHNLPWREIHNQALCYWQTYYANPAEEGSDHANHSHR